jgi:hypothetical protein
MSVRRVYVAGGPTDGLNVEFVRGYVRRAGWVFETCERCDLVIVVPSALPSTVRWTELDVALRKLVTPDDYDVVLTGPVTIRKPDGRPLCVYVPGGIREEADAAYPILTTIRGTTDGRSLASGTPQQRFGPGGNQMRSMNVMSSVLGAMDPAPRHPYCRLTAFSAKETEKWAELTPLWQRAATLLKEKVPDRYAAQAREAERTHPHWVIPGTPFTTITINNSYSTGVHYDKGDLDAGFSCLGCLRRGEYTGGNLVFPEYRVAVEMQHGDLLLMDAHEAHGNTKMVCACGDTMLKAPCKVCGAERISLVCYFRTKMTTCASPMEEQDKHVEKKEMKLA